MNKLILKNFIFEKKIWLQNEENLKTNFEHIGTENLKIY